MKMEDADKKREELREHRDRIAIAAMQGLMRHWELVDEHGCALHDLSDTFASLAGSAMCEGWGADHPSASGETYAYALASDAYFISQEMLRCRNKLDQEVDLLAVVNAELEPEARS